MKKLLILMLVILTLPLVNAESFGIGELNKPFYLFPQCQNSTWLNISSIYTNQNNYINSETATTKSGNVYNYTFLNTTEINTYYVNFHCNINNVDTPVSSYFIINSTGKENISGNTLIFFVILFLILIGLTCFLAINSIGHLMNLDFDLIDLSFNFGLFFVIVTSFYFENIYLGEPIIESYITIILSTLGIILILIPIIAIILSFTIGSLNNKQMNIKPRRKLR